MSDPIRPGEVVIAIRGCPQCHAGYGTIFEVGWIHMHNGAYRCSQCGKNPVNGPELCITGKTRWNFPRSWVIRLNGLSPAEKLEEYGSTRIETKAPAAELTAFERALRESWGST